MIFKPFPYTSVTEGRTSGDG